MKRKLAEKNSGLFSPRTISLILIGVIAGLVTAFYIMNTRAAKNISIQASEIFHLPVTVDDVNVSYVSHSVRITGLKIANPDGFTQPNVVAVEDMRIYTRGLNERPIPISRIEMNGIIFYPEHDANGETNLAYLLDNIFDTQDVNHGMSLSVSPDKIFLKDIRMRPQGEGYAQLERRIPLDNISPLGTSSELIEVTPEELVQIVAQYLSPKLFQTLLSAEVKAGIDNARQISQDFINSLKSFAQSVEQSLTPQE